MTKPKHKIRCGSVSATVWQNKITKDDKEFITHNITIEKNFKKDNEWQTTNSFGINDLPKVKVVAEKSFEFLTLKEETQKEPEIKEEKVEE